MLPSASECFVQVDALARVSPPDGLFARETGRDYAKALYTARFAPQAAIGAFAARDEEIDACCSAGLTDGRRRRAMQATAAKLAAHQAEERARLVQAERLRYSEAVGRIDLGDAIELLARWALNSNARRIPHLLRHLAEGRCMLQPAPM